MRRLAWQTCFMLVSVASLVRGEDVDFVRDIRPILADKCYACHGPDAEQRQADLRLDTKEGAFVDLGGHFAIVAGSPDQSELVRRINSADQDEVMPPPDHPKQLSDREKRVLATWVRQGAEWQDHWAYVVPRRHRTPEIKSGSAANFIDALIIARLTERGIHPSAAADRRTLIRRLSFDLTGLPPTAAEVEAFLGDRSDGAYEAIVDRLLSSQHYGERMAIYWLDLVRYADTVGYHGDQDVSVSPFRDYVINAFNNNMPLDRFTREQLAGDLLPNPTRDQLVASGYNKLGMMSAEGGVQPKEYLAKYIAERVRTASSVWLGSTLACAECHDHKFDPFTTKDFYRFAAFFADIQERGLYSGANRDGNWGPKVDVPDDELPGLLEPVEARIAMLQQTIDTSTPELEAAQRAWEQEFAVGNSQWQILQPTTVTALHDVKLKVLKDKSVLASGNNPAQNTYTFTSKPPPGQITGFRIEVLPDDSLPKKGPGRAGNGNFVLSEFRVAVASEGNRPTPVALHNAVATIEQSHAGDATPYGKWNAASAIDNDAKGSSWGWAILPEAGKPNEMTVETKEPLVVGEQTLTITLEQNHTNPKHTLGRFRLSATSSPPPLLPSKRNSLPDDIQQALAVAADQRSAEQQQQLSAYYRGSVAPILAEPRKQLATAEAEKAKLIAAHTRTSLITVSVDPREIRVLPRGNWMDDSGDVVQPGVPHFLKQLQSEDRATRADLAAWITARDNPLTARVFVNRLWKLFFGSGLSKVLDDLGSQGEPPVYPELLDSLAVEFVDSGWDVKHMVKLIVMSDTYRQSSLFSGKLLSDDPYNRLLARQSRFRLDAEMVRDNALAISGLLVRNVGGRSARPYQPAGLYRHLNFPQRQYKHDTGANQYRRGLYTHWQRQFLHPAMKAFDAPPREECTAERPRSNTPLAALVLLNDPSFVEAARVFAEKTIRGGGESTHERLDWMFKQSLSRTPNDEERAVIERLLQSHLKQYREQTAEAKKLISIGLWPVPNDLDVVELAAWTSIARTIFNLHETITRN